MIKIFQGGRGGDTFKTPFPPMNNFCLYPPPVLRSFWKDPLMTPHTPHHPTSSIFHCYPPPHPPPPLKILIIHYGVSNDLAKWRNQKYFSTWQSRAWETNKPGMSYINENSFSRWIIEKSDGLTTLGLQKLSEMV